MSTSELNATVVGRVDQTPDLMFLRIRPDAGVPNFTAGQYVAIGLPGSAPRFIGAPAEAECPPADKLIKRAYSIASSPEEREFVELYIAIVADGALTSRLAALQVSDRIYVAPKITGTFTLSAVPADVAVTMVATGTGLAPFVSMLRMPAVLQTSRRITLLHGVRYNRDLAYREELEALSQQYPHFQYRKFVTRETPEAGVEPGRVQSAFAESDASLDPSQHHIMLCGNPAMIDDIAKLLAPLGYEEHTRRKPGSLHFEKYW